LPLNDWKPLPPEWRSYSQASSIAKRTTPLIFPRPPPVCRTDCLARSLAGVRDEVKEFIPVQS
jgi:hypothetical protein